MPHTTISQLIVETSQWCVVLAAGLIASIVPEYSNEILRVIVTVVSMVFGAAASFYIKRLLHWIHGINKNNKNETNQ